MTPPSTIAHYRIISKLGEGGMGAVYRATDTKLNRDVAIKILPDSFAADPDRMVRFEREAQVLASLNHPNIAAIYGIEQGALVMELVQGQDLAGPVPLDTALAYAKQIAAGLEAAHEKSVVHRDLKPANIKVTADGVVKLLDFGLAKAGGESAPPPGATQSPTMSLAMTQAGMILGTAAYMSPEQARGKPVDKRADIWAFGVVLFELLTGHMLFGGGETVSDSLAAVITKEPDFGSLPKDTPPHVVRLLRRCLLKDPKLRLRDIGEARLALDEPPDPTPVAAEASAEPTQWIAATICATLAAFILAALLWRASRPVERPLLNLSVDLGPEASSAGRATFAVSPDGSRLVYVASQGAGQSSLAIRELNQPKGTVLAGTTSTDPQPFFSPDGQWIGFFADRQLKKVPITGGAPIPLCEALNPRGGSWGEDGQILFVPGSTIGVFAVSANGGIAQPLTKTASGEITHRWPQRLPGGDAFLFSVNSVVTSWENAEVVVWSQKTGQRKTLVRGGYYGRYLPNGYLVYVHGGKLFAVRFSLSRLEIIGTPQAIVDDIAGGDQTGSGQFDFSHNGLLVYLAGKGLSARYSFGWMAAGGTVEPLNGAVRANYSEPRLSPDGKELLLLDSDSLIIWDFARESMTRLPQAGASPWYSMWTPDGRHLLYGTRGAGYDIFWRRSDGSGEPVTLLHSAEPVTPYALSFDGHVLVYGSGLPGRTSLRVLPIDTADLEHPRAGAPEPLAGSVVGESNAVFSPDGRWLAYRSAGSGGAEIDVRPFRGTGKVSISSSDAYQAKWSRAGHQLFYTAHDNHVMVVDYTVSGDNFIPGKPRRWSDTTINPAAGRPSFDVSLDGKRLLAFPSEESVAAGDVHATFLVNFFDEVKRRLP